MPRPEQALSHNFTMNHDHGWTKVKCRCGEKSDWLRTNEEVVAWCNAHTVPNQGIVRGAYHGVGVIRQEAKNGK